jgi:hypothetical protein
MAKVRSVAASEDNLEDAFEGSSIHQPVLSCLGQEHIISIVQIG